ncbi:hypothetical protein TNCV_1512691 [Trichonephila clavipes]|nr:hypothetical protein TNCV_1512691 [Trichonephila clavipes]
MYVAKRPPVASEFDVNKESNQIKPAHLDISGAAVAQLGQSIGSWQACDEFDPSTTKDPSCSLAMHVKSVESSNVLPLVW